MQKDMNIDTLSPAIVYDQPRIAGRTQHSDSIVSNVSMDPLFDMTEIDPEIVQAMLDFEGPDSPKTNLRKGGL